MKRFMLIFLFVLAMSCIAGCWGTLNEQFVRAVDSNWSVMGPNYTAYVQADEVLPEASKIRRLKALAEFTLLIEEAKAQIDK